MQRLIHRHRRWFSTGILLAFMAAWVLPAQAGMMEMGSRATPMGCPDCPSPCSAPCCATMAACAAMLPTVAAPAPSLDKAIPVATALPAYSAPAFTAPTDSPRRYSPPSSLNIRFCSFQE